MRLSVLVAMVIALALPGASARAEPLPPQVQPQRHVGQQQRVTCGATKSYLVDRRTATWHWQDELEVSRSETRYPERWARGCGYLRWSAHLWQGRANQHWKMWVALSEPEKAIRHVFGAYADEALSVAGCESGLSVWAHNGQYLGLYQMGSGERARYGHGDTPLIQARAAYAYFVASGRDWSPWSCKP